MHSKMKKPIRNIQSAPAASASSAKAEKMDELVEEDDAASFEDAEYGALYMAQNAMY